MDKQVASSIIDLMVEFGDRLNSSVIEVKCSSSEEEFNNYKNAVGKIMGYMLLDVINPIVEEYPDLKPEGLD